MGLAKLATAQGDAEAARALLDRAPASAQNDAGLVAARAGLALAEQAASLGDVGPLQARVAADPDDHQARFDLALALAAREKREEAADALLDIIRRDRSWSEDGARRQLLQFFRRLGADGPGEQGRSPQAVGRIVQLRRPRGGGRA